MSSDIDIAMNLKEFLPPDRQLDTTTASWTEDGLDIFALKIPVRRKDLNPDYCNARIIVEVQFPRFMVEEKPETNHIVAIEIQKAFDIIAEMEKLL